MLHGKIELNEIVIGEWSAINKGSAGDGDQTLYECWVRYRNNRGYPLRAQFELVHSTGEGALVLAGKVMIECINHLEPDHLFPRD